MNLPEQICTSCINDLEIAYRFRTNCESSEAILKSFIESAATDFVVSHTNALGETYNFRPPSGLNVRLVKPTVVNKNKQVKLIKDEPQSDEDDLKHDIIIVHEEEINGSNEHGEIEHLSYLDDEGNIIDSQQIIQETEVQELTYTNDVKTCFNYKIYAYYLKLFIAGCIK